MSEDNVNSSIGWVRNDFVPHSPFVDKRADKNAAQRASLDFPEGPVMSNRDLLRKLGVSGEVPFAEAARNAGLAIIPAAANDNIKIATQRAA